MINESMLRQLRAGLKSLKVAEAAQNQMVDQMIEALPEDKKKEAIRLINQAKKGKVDVGEMMNFASDVRDLDKKKFQETVEKAVEKIEQKKKDAAKKKSATKKPKAKS